MTRTPEETAEWIITELVTDAMRKREIARAIRQAIRKERDGCEKECHLINETTPECPELAQYCAAAIRNREPV